MTMTAVRKPFAHSRGWGTICAGGNETRGVEYVGRFNGGGDEEPTTARRKTDGDKNDVIELALSAYAGTIHPNGAKRSSTSPDWIGYLWSKAPSATGNPVELDIVAWERVTKRGKPMLRLGFRP